MDREKKTKGKSKNSPNKTAEALNLYEQNKGFVKASPSKQKQILAPYKNMDRMEEELKNLDIVNTSDKMSNKLKIVRRNSAIQKDFFSAAEYLVYAVNQYIELDYYKKKKTNGGDRLGAFIFESVCTLCTAAEGVDLNGKHVGSLGRRRLTETRFFTSERHVHKVLEYILGRYHF